ncbi:MAG: hypothetical protein ACE149_02170 [Armatimonadota bacterium]
MLTRDYDGCTNLLVATDLWQGRLATAAVCCVFDGVSGEWHALVDTAACWSIMPGDLARQLSIDIAGRCDTPLETRFGRLDGSLVRHPVHLRAREGEPLSLEPTWWVSDEWPCGPVIGWYGFLESIRFGFDPGTQASDEPEFLYTSP